MLSHTVPRRLLDNFAHDDQRTKSRRLWRYEKNKPPYNRIPPSRATAWDGHFADPDENDRETRIEQRLQREFEDPVNAFMDQLQNPAFVPTPRQQVLLGHYLRMLFHRSTARRNASESEKQTMVQALKAVRDNPAWVAEIIKKWTIDMLYRGMTGAVTRRMVYDAISERIMEVLAPGWSQRSYLDTMERMMEFHDDLLTRAEYRIVATPQDRPFVIGDAPVVSWIRTSDNALSLGEGFGRPGAEVFLPVFPTACLHVLPPVDRTLPLRPSADEVNRAQASLATKQCFANVESRALDEFLQQYFGTVRMGIDGYRLGIDAATMFFNLLMKSSDSVA